MSKRESKRRYTVSHSSSSRSTSPGPRVAGQTYRRKGYVEPRDYSDDPLSGRLIKWCPHPKKFGFLECKGEAFFIPPSGLARGIDCEDLTAGLRVSIGRIAWTKKEFNACYDVRIARGYEPCRAKKRRKLNSYTRDDDESIENFLDDQFNMIGEISVWNGDKQYGFINVGKTRFFMNTQSFVEETDRTKIQVGVPVVIGQTKPPWNNGEYRVAEKVKLMEKKPTVGTKIKKPKPMARESHRFISGPAAELSSPPHDRFESKPPPLELDTSTVRKSSSRTPSKSPDWSMNISEEKVSRLEYGPPRPEKVSRLEYGPPRPEKVSRLEYGPPRPDKLSRLEYGPPKPEKTSQKIPIIDITNEKPELKLKVKKKKSISTKVKQNRDSEIKSTKRGIQEALGPLLSELKTKRMKLTQSRTQEKDLLRQQKEIRKKLKKLRESIVEDEQQCDSLILRIDDKLNAK